MDELELRQRTLDSLISEWSARRDALETRHRAALDRLSQWRAKYSGNSAQASRETRVQPFRQRSAEQIEALRVLRARLEHAKLIAPADAEVISVLARMGDVVRAGEPLVLLNGGGLRQVVAYVHERDGKLLRPGIHAVVRLAFRRAVLAEERARVAERVVEIRRRMKGTVLRQVAAGLREADETDLTEVVGAEAESEFRRSLDRAQAEKRKLARLIDSSGSLNFSLTADPALFEIPPPAADRAELVTRAIRMRADAEAIAGACRELTAMESLARMERYPWIRFAQVTYRTTPILDRGAFQIGVDLPLFRSGAAAEARVASAQRNRWELQHRALQSAIQTEVEESMENLENVRKDLAELERLRSGPAQRAFERTRSALALGRADQVEVLNAEARVLALRDRWLERRMQYASVEALLETAIGDR